MKIEKLISPWKENPSAQENFYNLTEEVIEEIIKEEEVIDEEEEVIENPMNEEQNDDPYSDILKEI